MEAFAIRTGQKWEALAKNSEAWEGWEEAFAEIEEMLVTLGGIAHRWRLPEPIWHGHSQAVYKPTFTSDFLSLDLVVMARSSNNWYIEKERHGDIVVLVDREGLLNSPCLDHEELMRLREKMIWSILSEVDSALHACHRRPKYGTVSPSVLVSPRIQFCGDCIEI